MSDKQTGAATAQAATSAQPLEGTGSSAPAAGAQSSQVDSATEESGTVEVAQVQSDLRATRREAQKLRERIAEFEQKEQERKAAAMTDLEKRDARIAELERLSADKDRQLQERLVRYETIRQASRLGFADPEDAYRLLDVGALEFDKDGQAQNIEPQLAALLRQKPYLASASVRVGTSDAGRRGTPDSTNGQPTMSELLRIAAGK